MAITTFDLDALRISVPPLRGFSRRAILIIHNDNSNAELNRATVKKLGWRGELHIINSSENRGEVGARIAILDYMVANNMKPDWVLFADDDDVIINIDVPTVDANNFAVIQNTTVLSGDISDVFKISQNWVNGSDYGDTGPRFGIAGALIRLPMLIEFADFIRPLLPHMYHIANATRYRVPWSTVMWNGLNIFARARHPDASPIYMNQTNYVAIKLGRATQKYGKTIPTKQTGEKIIQKFNELFAFAVADKK